MKKRVTIDELMPLNFIDASPASLSSHLSLPIILGQQAHIPPMMDSRKGKGVIDDLTTNIEGIALYRSLALGKLDHHMSQLSYMAYERQLNSMREGVDADVILSHLMYQVSVSSTLFPIEP